MGGEAMVAPRYLIIDGLRVVEPYWYTFKTPAKGRWIGKLVLQVFTQEFSREEQFYRNSIDTEKLLLLRDVNMPSKTQTLRRDSLYSTLIKNGDVIQNIVHKHEPPVSTGDQLYRNQGNRYSSYYGQSCSFQIIYEDNNILIINKPSGVPVHPTGHFYYNSVTEILKHEFQIPNGILHTCHRLDKLTSGIVMLAKTPEKARELAFDFRNKLLCKKYVARVLGNFPEGDILCNDPVFLINPGHNCTDTPFISVPLKTATTKFRKLAYDKSLNESIVECEPFTGRTHQIRLHLRNIGHPIVNDPAYGPHTKSPMKNQIELALTRDYKLSRDKLLIAYLDVDKYKVMQNEFRARIASYRTQQNCCQECGELLFDRRADSDEMFIYLHALRYGLLDNVGGSEIWSFESEMPKWAFKGSDHDDTL